MLTYSDYTRLLTDQICPKRRIQYPRQYDIMQPSVCLYSRQFCILQLRCFISTTQLSNLYNWTVRFLQLGCQIVQKYFIGGFHFTQQLR